MLIGEHQAVRARDHAGPGHLVAAVVDLDDGLDVHDRRDHPLGDLDDARLERLVGVRVGAGLVRPRMGAGRGGQQQDGEERGDASHGWLHRRTRGLS